MDFVNIMQQQNARVLGVHVLVGKRRIPQPRNNPSAAQYSSVWAFVPISQGNPDYDAFNAAVMDKVNTLAQQESEGGALTFFSPIGKYMSLYMTPFLIDLPEGVYLPPPTSIMTNPSTRSDDRRPLWVEFQVHNLSSSVATEVDHQLRRLDSMLSNGPDGHNTLHLTEVPASAPELTTTMTIDKRDHICVAELCILLSTLNSPSEMVQNIVTRFGTISKTSDEQAIFRQNYDDLLNALSRDLFFLWVREGDMETVARKSIGDEEPGLLLRPGFTMLMQRYTLELSIELGRLSGVIGN